MVEPRSITFVVICDRLFHLPEQRFGGDPPEFKRIDIHRGDRKLRHLRDLGIVKAQYTEPFGNADAELSRAAQRGERHFIVAADHSIGRSGARKERFEIKRGSRRDGRA